MNQELMLYFPSKGRMPRRYLLLFLLLGLGSSLSQLFLAQPDTPEILYVKWNVIFGQISVYARLSACVVLQYLLNFYKRYGALRIILYLAFVFFLSYVIVAHVLDRAAIRLWELFEDNVIRRLDDSVVIIEESRNESTSMRRVKEKPKSIEEHFIYNGEDISFRCYDVLNFDAEVVPADNPVIWRHNDELVFPSEKVKIEFSFHKIDELESIMNEHNPRIYSYLIDSTLTIYLVDDSDYGNYTCHLRQAAKMKVSMFRTETNGHQQHDRKQVKPDFIHEYNVDIYLRSCMCICIMSFEDFVRQFEEMLSKFYSFLKHLQPIQMPKEDLPNVNVYDWTGVFMLTKINESVQVVSAPPGGIVSISASYLNLAEQQDVSLGYVINGKAYHEVCDGQLRECSFFVWVYWAFWHASGHFGPIPTIFLYWLNMQSSILGITWQCACPSSYGNHVFRFTRHFYNITSGTNEVIEVEHPKTIKLVPRTADILLAFQNESTPKPVGAECFDSLPLIGICSSVMELIIQLHNQYFLIEKLIIFGLFIAGLVISFIINKYIMGLVIACRNVILEGHFWQNDIEVNTKKALGNIGSMDKPFTYDVYLSHADTQLTLAAELTSTLEGFGMKVFYRGRDVAAGDYITESVANAIVSSSRFLVIASQEFIDSELHNSFEFGLMLSQVHDKKVDEADVMVVKYGPCDIANYFSNFTSISILDMERLCPEEFSNQFKNWCTGQKSNKSCMSIVTLAALCLCLGALLTIPRPNILTAVKLFKTLCLFWLDYVANV